MEEKNEDLKQINNEISEIPQSNNTEKPKTDVLALLSFIFGIVGLANVFLNIINILTGLSSINLLSALGNIPFSVVALVFAIIRKRKLEKDTKMYKYAQTGFILGIIGTVLYAIMLTIGLLVALSIIAFFFN